MISADKLFILNKNAQLILQKGILKAFKGEFVQRFFSTSKEKTYKIGIIGCGPSALYCCKYILKNENIKVDIFDKLPNPYGLVRYGVAPDHINIKNIYKTFDSVFSNKNVRFFGNVNIGIDVEIKELKKYYNACLFSCGAADASLPPIEGLIEKDAVTNIIRTNTDIRKGTTGNTEIDTINGIKTNGIFHARDIIFFYNNYYKELRESNIQTYLNNFFNFENAVIIGNGNVSLDIARILNKNCKELETTDINDDFLDAMKKHSLKHIYVIGRRGFGHSSFSNAELRELLTLPKTKVILNKKYYDMCAQLKNYDENDKMRKRQNLIFLNMVQNYEEYEKNKNIYKDFKIIEFIFYHEIKKIQYVNEYLKSVELERNKLFFQDSNNYNENQKIVTPLLIYATGFKKNALNEKLYKQSVEEYKKDICEHKWGVFKSGWFDTNAKGNIASQIINAKNNTSQIFTFLKNVKTFFQNDICDFLKQKKIRYVSFNDWLYIDHYEKQMGSKKKKISQKLETINQVLQILNQRKIETNIT